MKKIMIAAAIVCAAAFAQAGTVTWGLDSVVNPDSGMAYLFNSSEVSAATIDAVLASISAGTFESTYASKAAFSLEIEDGELYKQKAITDITGSTTLWMVAVDDESKPTMAFVGEEVTKTIGSSGAQNFAWTYADNTTAWQSVPEPTSGLLLLLGVAGLALRRRRA